MDPAKFERAVGKSSVTNFELQINDSEGLRGDAQDGAKAIEVMGQLGKLGDKTLPARILEYVGLRSKMYSILTVQPDGARKEKRKIKGVPKKAVTNVRHLEYREVLEEGSERRAAFAQLRSRAHEIAVETVEKKSLSPFMTLTTRGRWGTGATWSSCGCWALTLHQAPRPSTS